MRMQSRKAGIKESRRKEEENPLEDILVVSDH